MAIDICNVTEEQKVDRRMKYAEFIRQHSLFWSCLKDKYKNYSNKSSIKPFTDIVRAWMFDCPFEYRIKGRTIEFGNYKRDGWCYYYDWRKGVFGSIVRQRLTEEEQAQEKEKLKYKELEKCKKLGLDSSKIGTIYENKELKGVKIRWDGIEISSRKFPIIFYDFETNKQKIMKLDYFKSHYYEGGTNEA